MAEYNGRRAPNVSQYIANLNTIPSPADIAAQQDFAQFDDDLAMFTNTEFFDFDMNGPIAEMPGYTGEQQRQVQGVPQDPAKNMGFVNQPNFGYNEFNNIAGPQRMSNHASPHYMTPSPPNGVNVFGANKSFPTIPTAAAFASAQSPSTGDKRKSLVASVPSTADLEEESRYAAEEDKRRRNTAASARFRVKKKQREQALEKTAKEMSDKVQILEARVGQLEMENKWLKGLITEKNLKPDADTAAAAAVKAEDQSKQVADAKDAEDSKTADERIASARSDGVGTEVEA